MPNLTANGKQHSPERLREMERRILDGPVPLVTNADEAAVAEADPDAAALIGKECRCFGRDQCTPESPCSNCRYRRRYVALRLHWRRHGKAPHPGDALVIVPFPGTGLLEEVDSMDLKLGEEIQPLESLPVLGVEGYVIKGLSNVLSAPPKAGKTSLVYQSVPAWLQAGERILCFTEEPKVVWQQRLKQLDLIDQRGLVLVFALGVEPGELLGRVKEGSESVVVLDTLRGLKVLPEEEQDNGSMSRLLEPWIVSCRQGGKTLLGIHHDRKAGGSHGRNLSGAHALVGVFDVILSVRHGQDDRRILSALSRVCQPPELTYELVEGDLVPAPGNEALLKDIARKKPDPLALLPTAPPGWTLDDVVREAHVATGTALAALKDGRVRTSGGGKKGDPKRYWIIR